MKKKVVEYKQIFARDAEMVNLAKRLKAMRRLRAEAEAKLNALRAIVDNTQFANLKEISDMSRKQIHFLFWNTVALRRQIDRLKEFRVLEPAFEDKQQFREMERRWVEQFQVLANIVPEMEQTLSGGVRPIEGQNGQTMAPIQSQNGQTMVTIQTQNDQTMA
jgi:hypothetical protein